MSLRRRVIRLAHQKPELRPHLLPLLAESRKAYSHLANPLYPIFDKGCDRIRDAINSITMNNASTGYNDLDDVDHAVTRLIVGLNDQWAEYDGFEPATDIMDEIKDELRQLQQMVEEYKGEIDDQALYDEEPDTPAVIEFMEDTVVYNLEDRLDDIEGQFGRDLSKVDREFKKKLKEHGY